MLDFMRRKAQSPYIQATILVIIVVFVFWGVGTNHGNGQRAVVTVNGEAISLIEYQQAYDQAAKRLREQLGGNLPPGFLESVGLKEKVINDLTQRLLFRQAAREMGIIVTDDEVRDKIASMEVFKNNGAFDPGWYRQVLASSRMSTTEFEEATRNDLLMAKLMDFISGFAEVADSELKDRFDFRFGERRVSWVKLRADDFRDRVKVDEKELESFFERNKAKYRSEPRVRVSYLRFPFAGKEAAAAVSDRDIAAYYRDHLSDYQLPERRRARHILVKVSQGADTAELAEKEKKAASLMERLRRGEDFATLARLESDDPGSAANGGDLGFFPRGQMVKPFEDAVFSMNVGDIRKVRSRFGFHIIKLDAISPSRTRELAEVKDEIRKKLVRERGKNLAYKKADQAYEKIILAGSLAKYCDQAGVKPVETGLFTRSDAPGALKKNREFVRAAFSLKQGELSSLLEGTDSYAIIYVEERQEPEDPKLAQVRKRVEKDFTAFRAAELARESAEKVLKNVASGRDLAAALKEEKVKAGVDVTPYFSRAKLSAAKLPPQVAAEAVSLTADRPVPDRVIEEGRAYYVIAFKDAREPVGVNFYNEKEKIREAMRRTREAAMLAAWAENLRSRAEIEIDREFIHI